MNHQSKSGCRAMLVLTMVSLFLTAPVAHAQQPLNVCPPPTCWQADVGGDCTMCDGSTETAPSCTDPNNNLIFYCCPLQCGGGGAQNVPEMSNYLVVALLGAMVAVSYIVRRRFLPSS